MNTQYQGKVCFAVGTGRCGTKFLTKLLQYEPTVSSVHERNPLNETFHRYTKWYDLPIDGEGFLKTKQIEIEEDLQNYNFSFEASAHLSLSIIELHKHFDAKIVLMVRRPDLVVNSYRKKGWYASDVVTRSANLALGYQHNVDFHHFLGRIVPRGNVFEVWKRNTQVGKLAWFWNNLNKKVVELLEAIPETHWRIQKLEDMTYDKYIDLCQFMGISATITRERYITISNGRPNAILQVPTIADWSARDIGEFEREVAPMALKLGYSYKVSELPIYSPKKPTSLEKIRRIGGDIRRLARTFSK